MGYTVDDTTKVPTPPKPKKKPKKKKVVYYYYRGRRFTSRAARDSYARRWRSAQKVRRPGPRRPSGPSQRERDRQRLLREADKREALLREQAKARALKRELRRRAEIEAAKRRREAFDSLKKRYGDLLTVNRKKPRPASRPDEREVVEREKRIRRALLTPLQLQQKKALELQARDKRRVAGTRRSSGPKIKNEYAGERRRRVVLEDLRRTRDYEKVLKALQNDQAATGGRYLDRKLYEATTRDFNQYAKDVDKRAGQAVDRAYKLAGWRKVNGVWTPPKKQDAAKTKLMRAFLASDEYKQAIAQWRKVYGDGRKGGQGARVAKLFQAIATANDEYFHRAVFGYADASTRLQVEEARREIDKKLTRRRYGGTYKITLQQYLDELAAEERMLMSKAQERALAFRRAAIKEGYQFQGDGGMVSRQWATEIVPVLDRALGSSQRRSLLKQLNEGNQVERERARGILIDRAMEQRRSELEAALKIGPRFNRSRVPMLERHLEAYRDTLYRNLTGSAAPDGLERLLEGATRTPLLGEVLKGLGFLAGGIGGGLRWGSTYAPEYIVDKNGKIVLTGREKGGRAHTVDLNLGALTELGKPGGQALLTRDFKDSEQELRDELQQKLEFSRAIQEADGDWGKIVEAIGQYGAEPFQGNVGNFIAGAALDPLIAVNISKFLKAGKLAGVRQGGIAGLIGNPGTSLADIYKLTLPKSLGGYGRSALTLRETLHDLEKLVGRQIRGTADLDPDALQTALRSLLEHPRTMKEATNFIEKQFKVTPANAAQILSSVQAYAAKKGGAVGLRVVDAATFERNLVRSDSLARTAPAQAAKGIRKLRTEVAAPRETALAYAAREARLRAAGQPAPKQPAIRTPRTATAAAELDTARRELHALYDRQSTLAVQARALASHIRRTGPGDEPIRIADYRKLQETLDEYDSISTQLLHNPRDPRDPRTRIELAQDRYEQAIIDARVNRRPTVEDTHVELVKDLHFIEGHIKQARVDLRNAAPAGRPAAQQKLRDLGAAHRVVQEAMERTKKQSKVANEVVRRGREKAKGFIRRPRVSAKAESVEGVLEEGSRDLYRRYAGSEVNDSRTPLTSTEKTQLGEFIARTSIPFQPGPLIPDELDGLNLWEALVAVHSVVVKGNQIHVTALTELLNQAMGFLPRGVPFDEMMDFFRRLHIEDEGLDLDEFEGLFKNIIKEFRKAGIAERQGAVRFYDQGPRKKTVGANVDYELAQTAAKIRALRGSDVSLHAYDELRRPFGDAIVKVNTSDKLRRDAIALASKTGQTFDEAYEVVYARRLDAEAGTALRAFAMKPEYRGMLPDEILELFEESQLRTDLKTGKAQVSGFLHRSMKKAIAKNSGLRKADWVDDPAYMGRVLGGNTIPPEGMRIATPEERFGIADAVPVFVAADNHPFWPSQGAYRGMHTNGYGIVINESLLVGTPPGNALKTVLHEYGHGLWTANYHAGHPSVQTVIDEVDAIISSYGAGLHGFLATSLSNPLEVVAELHAMWVGRGVDLSFVDVNGARQAVPSWDDLRARLHPQDRLGLDRLGAAYDQLLPPERAGYGFGGVNVPPMTTRQEAYQWLVDNGFWSRRTGQRVREGGAVWSIDQERDFFQTSFGFSPPWTDADLIRGALDDPKAFHDLMTQFGYLDNGFELHAAALNLDADGLANAIAFGDREAAGIKRGRSRQELRDWFAQRFGDLVTEEIPTPAGGVTRRFRAAPWLMDAGSDEYKAFVDRILDDGVILNPTLVKPEQMAKFKDAYKKAIDRRLERILKTRKMAVNDDWLPQEQMRFAIDVTNELLMSREWRSFGERAPVGHRALRWIGEVQRLLVVAQIAFPVMNLIDRFTVKQVLLMVANGGYRFWSHVDEDAMATVSELRSINIRERGIWDLRTATGWQRLRDTDLSKRTRIEAIGDTVLELPYQISSWGEDSLKLNFARRMYQQVRDDLVAEGVDFDQARVLALGQVRKRVLKFFPSMEDAGDIERALNQLVPFLSYNFRNQVLGLKVVASHPWLWNLQQQIGDVIEDSNRREWDRLHPGVPLPDKYARRLMLRLDGEVYAVDLANFSDWFRGPERFASEGKDPDTVADWVHKTFVRFPHPTQQALLAWLTKGETPWGTKASVSSFLPIADFLPELFGPGETEGMNPIEFWSSQFFFEAFAKVTPTEARAMLYFDLVNAGERDKANALLDQYPDVELWLQEHTDPKKFRLNESWSPSWFRGRSRDEVRAYEAAKAGLEEIRKAFDAQLMALYDQPWSDEYKLLKKQRRAAILAYTLEHRELFDARVMAMTWRDWGNEMVSWINDDLIDDFFAMDVKLNPKRDAFKSELAYLKAKAEYLDWRKAWMAAHPGAAGILMNGLTSLEKAWNQQNEHWRELERQAVQVRIAIGEEERKGARKDPALIDALYDMLDQQYARLDAEAFADVYAAADGWAPRLRDGAGLLSGIVAQKFTLPGRADFFYRAADEAGKAKIRGTEAFHLKFRKIVEGGSKDFYGDLERAGILDEYLAKNPGKRVNYEAWRAFRDGGPDGFYPLLIRRGWLDDYLKANPDKRDNYERWAAFNGGTSTKGLGRYAAGIMSVFRRAKDGRDFYRLLAADPWLQAEYFRRHPDRAAKFRAGQQYFNAMKKWVGLLERDRFEEAEDFFNSLPAWIKDRYYSKHPEKRRKARQSSGYAAAMGKWVALLKQNKFDEARRWFDNLPEEYRQRYFAKHPEARARHGGEDRMLDQARAYFVADKPTQLRLLEKDPAFAKWLRKNGGEEETRRGLILAAYRTIAKGDAWLRRVFRERYPEIFSQEAQGERRLAKVARNLAEHPELFDLYNRWVEAQYLAYSEQYKRSVPPPDPFQPERVRRWRERRRKRAARFSPLHVTAA